ncbi:TetR family transcriptional regulator [Saccharibacillus sp. O23]|uniref:TetR/AcrR family transcriptional regulator n=1 Tax=Saccharibacillus sp. O23 TaxID=2009338 RepID=UPI000B4E4964|nr:TetR/AcrR family transcriptional regulator [Saccharibacillus sp. O23]OWR27461.1 TetR family transcriptional regulator [Saccharibacillus sp. O23]
MPKIVDHEQQKIKVAEAAWRVIRQSGIENASVRNVAQEAGISPGSMRHYFSTQSELFLFSMNLVSERANARIAALSFDRPMPEVVRDMMRELLPLNEEKRSEMEVWLAFMSRSIWDAALHDLANRVYEEMNQGMIRTVAALAEQGLVRKELDAEEEGRRMQVFVDGIALHGLLYPERMTPEYMERLLDQYLEELYRK